MAYEPLDSTPWREQLRKAPALVRLGMYCVAFVVLPGVASVAGSYVECGGSCGVSGDPSVLAIVAGLSTVAALTLAVVSVELGLAVRRYRRSRRRS